MRRGREEGGEGERREERERGEREERERGGREEGVRGGKEEREVFGGGERRTRLQSFQHCVHTHYLRSVPWLSFPHKSWGHRCVESLSRWHKELGSALE